MRDWRWLLLLLVNEHLHRLLEVVAHEALHGVSIKTDDLTEHLFRQHRLTGLFVLADDLQQNLTRQIFATADVENLDRLTVNDQAADVIQRDVRRDRRVIETAIRILLDNAGLVCHLNDLLDYQPMYCPPLADKLAPVIQDASSGIKKPTAYAISSGEPRRPVGICAMILLRTSSGTAITMSVPM